MVLKVAFFEADWNVCFTFYTRITFNKPITQREGELYCSLLPVTILVFTKFLRSLWKTTEVQKKNTRWNKLTTKTKTDYKISMPLYNYHHFEFEMAIKRAVEHPGKLNWSLISTLQHDNGAAFSSTEQSSQARGSDWLKDWRTKEALPLLLWTHHTPNCETHRHACAKTCMGKHIHPSSPVSTSTHFQMLTKNTNFNQSTSSWKLHVNLCHCSLPILQI